MAESEHIILSALIDLEEDDICNIFQKVAQEPDVSLELLKEMANGNIHRKRNRIKDYFEKTVPSYSEVEFKMHFRVSRSLFQNISQMFAQSEIYNNMRKDKRMPASKNIAIFLWFAGHEACSFRELADQFNVSLSTASRVIDRCTMFISNLSPQIIQWPSEQNKKRTAEFVEQKCGFGKTIGFIGSTHIVIDSPKNAKNDYINRKGDCSIIMQGICDENKKFIDVFIGFPGSSHDSWVFQNSPISRKLKDNCGEYYILGDWAYPTTKKLISPYRDTGNLKRHQKNFNMQLNSGRVTIEHAFGFLKRRFPQLYYCKLRGIKKMSHFIRACVVLHNIVDEDDLDLLGNIEVEIQSNKVSINNLEDRKEATKENEIRDAISRTLSSRQCRSRENDES